MKRIISLIMAIMLTVTMLPTAEIQAAAKKPAVAKTAVVALNGTKKLSITKNGYTIKKVVSVKSSKKSVARATANKKAVTVYGIKAGTAKITVKVKAKKGKKTKSFTLATKATVKNPTASLAKTALNVGDTTVVKKANIASGAKVTYKSSSATVASVSTKGVVTAKAGGSAAISVTVVLPKTKYAKKTTKTIKAGTVKVTSRVDAIIKKMSNEEKIAQMMMPSFRDWGGEDAVDLSKASGLAEALRRHQYGGVILFGQNIKNSGQTTRLISDLQANNAKGKDAARKGGPGAIPYFVSADVEGGNVNRLGMGTRGIGSMAIGATGKNAEKNAETAAATFGEEMSALGFNVDLAPLLDVVLDPADHGMCNRVFSDDADTNAKLGTAYSNSLKKNDIITTFKHFPGAGDGSDDPTAVQLTREQLDKTGLSAYQKAIDGGMEMLMVSAVTFPKLDDKQKLADNTEGYYPASASKKIITDILRNEMGYEGVVMTDALEMAQFVVEPETGAQLFAGDANSVEHGVAVCEACINAGSDILLMPTPGLLRSENFAEYLDSEIAGLAALVGKTISEKRLNESVKRILLLKEKHGILDMDTSGADVDAKAEKASKIVGSAEHHAAEEAMAQEAVTLLKNDGVLPVSAKAESDARKIVIVANTKNNVYPIKYGLKKLKTAGQLAPEARIEDRTGDTVKAEGSASSKVSIIIDTYATDTLEQSVNGADIVFCVSSVYSGDAALQDTMAAMKGVNKTMSLAKEAGAKFVLLSACLPTDAARFSGEDQADAIVCSYMSGGFAVDPFAATEGSENPGAYNAMLPAAIVASFGGAGFTGELPIDIHSMSKDSDGRWSFDSEVLYPRGSCSKPEKLLASMTDREKIEQMLMPALRKYNEENATTLHSDLKAFFGKHGLGGVILYASNITGTEQTLRLTDALQNANGGKAQMMITTDQEGGTVTRLTTGTQMIGNMALAATGDVENAKTTGEIIGKELSALGINSGFSPVVDVNNNPKNPVIGVRSFSDDPNTVAAYGCAFADGLKGSGTIATLKHFPGHGDTATDSHTGFPVVDKSYEQLKANELVPFKAAIDGGAEMIMTAHIQYPQVETTTYKAKDGSTVYLPATLSKKIITGVLREDLGFDGVVMTDALEMDAISKYFDQFDAAKLAINAGVDILLLPCDLTDSAKIEYLESYIDGIVAMVEDGEIDRNKVDAAVLRILRLKDKKGLLADYSSDDLTERIASAKKIVGSQESHDKEWAMAKKAITLVKNDNGALPINASAGKTAVLYPELASNPKELSVTYAINRLKSEGKLAENANVVPVNYNKKTADEVKDEIKDASNVIILTSLAPAAYKPAEGNDAALIDSLIDYAHARSAKVTLISGGLPYNAARFQSADAILLTYSNKGMKELPGTREGEIMEYGPNIPAAVYLAFARDESPEGKLPVNIPKLSEYAFTDSVLYERGYGLKY